MANLKVTALAFALSAGLVACVSEQTVVEGTRGGQTEVGSEQQARTRMSLGLTYLQRGENAQAIFNLEKAKELAPNLPEVWNALAYYYEQVDELELAEDAYRTSLRKDDNNADTYNNFGAFLCQNGKYKQAEELLLAAVKRPGYIRVADSYENLAYCALAQEDFTKYKQYLLNAVKHSSSRQNAVYNLATLEYAMGDMAEAKKWQTRLQNLGQVSAQATLLRYLIAYRTGDAAEQQVAEKFLVSVYPTSKETGMVLAGDFRESEPDKLRQRYKASVVGSQTPEVAETQPVATPKMKIVKRKSADDSAPQAMAQEEPLPAEQQFTPDASPAESTMAADTTAVTESPNAVASNASEQPSDVTNNAVSTEPAQTSYVVKSGDTLYRIASKFRLSVSELQQLNQLSDTSLIREGMTLKVAKAAITEVPAKYTVGDGETLFSIAFKFNLKMEQLLELNQLAPGQELTPGQSLILRANEPAL